MRSLDSCPCPVFKHAGCAGTGVRVDTWVETGTDVTPFYDSLLGKLMVHGSSRANATAKMSKALAGTVLGGIPSNLEYLRTIIASEGYHAGASPAGRDLTSLSAARLTHAALTCSPSCNAVLKHGSYRD